MNNEAQRVIVEHRHLDAEARALRILLDGGPDRLPIVFSALSTFASVLAEHLVHEHEVIDQALARKARRTGMTRSTLDDELRALVLDWQECLANWDEASAAREWSRFSEHLSALLARIQRRIAVEAELLRT
jgi:hypothetical protein